MTFNNLTKEDAIRIRDILKQLEEFESNEQRVINEARRVVVEAWWDTVKPDVPQTRDEALEAYRFIEEKLKTETDGDRLALLRQKLQLANEKFMERKKNG